MEPARRGSHVALHLPLLVIILATLSDPSVANQVLYSGGSLSTGQTLSVKSYVVIMQSDCNLVFYDAGTAIWASGSHGKGYNCHATMQSDGNLVVYNGRGSAVWASNTDRAMSRFKLVLQNDRNLVIYGPTGAIWATGTNHAGAKASVPKDAVVMTSGVLLGGGNATTPGGGNATTPGGGNATTPSAVAAAGEGSKN